MQSGKVPMFTMRPQSGTLWLAVIILLLGLAAFFNGHRDPGDIASQDRAHFFLMLSIIVAGILMIVATSRMWFKHLWHDRYDHKGRNRR